MSEPPSQGIALILGYLFGIFGADKFYVGLTGQGIAMVVLTCTIIGLFATIPWAYLSCLFLVIGILWKGKPMLYPDNIKWAPVTQTDTTIAWVIVAITVIGIIAGFFIGTRERFEYKKEIEDDEE
jgi:TM2 domain-containing membrane protein YozV